MRRHLVLCAAAILIAGLAEAGRPPIGPVLTLGEAGVVMLALGLVGGGIAALRRRSR
jgi:hypothetical protein